MKQPMAILFFTVMLYANANSQQRDQANARLVGGRCEGCEAVFEYGERALAAVDTLPDFHEAAVKIKVTGTVFQKDGKSPAEGVVLYIYHTDQHGIYATKGNATGWGKRHGYLRGWVKTSRDGRYAFYTFLPGTYPDRSSPAHIHLTVLEPNGKYYWLESYYFEGDSLLTTRELAPKSPRGGNSGLLSLKREGSLLVGERNIVLGRNIPNYE
ncbi:MAG: hypothetical protein DKINENOH_03638 [bacterium]|nr:hypothetical protein [bacterium]